MLRKCRNHCIPGLAFVILVIAIQENALTHANEDKDTADKFLEVFMNISVSAKDCNPELTTATLDWLRGKPNEHQRDDPSWNRVRLPLFRAYLARKKFPATPGSIRFANQKDLPFHYACGKDREANTKWTSTFRNKGKKDKAVESDEDSYFVDKVPHLLYYRRVECYQKKSKCSHHFYVISRPAVKIVQRTQIHREGDAFEVKCEINQCYYTPTDEDCQHRFPKKLLPVFYPPVSIEWTVLGNGSNVIKETTKSNGYGIKDMKITWERTKKVVKVGFNETGTNFLISSTIKVQKAEKKHAGRYECIVTDKNGVPSTPDKKLEDKPDLQITRAYIHIREWYWVYIPIIIIAVLAVVTVLIEILSPERMEYDDGTPYTREELAQHDTERRRLASNSASESGLEFPKTDDTPKGLKSEAVTSATDANQDTEKVNTLELN